MARRLDTVRAAMTIDDELDDIKRARIWTQLEERLADAAPARRSRRGIAIGVAAGAVAAAAGLFVALAPRRDEPHTLAVPVDTVVSSRLGPHTSASIVGPAQLEIIGAAGEATAVRLRSGTLLAEFAGGDGRSLRIEAPGATIEVVGTLFAVAVRDGGTCTSVVHGRVRITTRSAVLHVAGGQRYCSGDSLQAVQPIADDVRDALARHRARGEPAEPAAQAAPATLAPPAIAAAPQAPVAVPSAPAVRPAPAATPPVPSASSVPAAPSGGPRSRVVPTPAIGALRDLDPTRRARPEAPAPAPPAPKRARSPEELYRTAEAALAARDAAGADRSLAGLVDQYPGSPLVDQAFYERARIAYQQRAWPAARSHLARLAAIPSTRLAEPGAYLRCRIAVESGEASAATCLAEYRAGFPRSPHDLDALALLVQLAHAGAGCAGAEKLVDELVQTYPRTTLAAAWRARCPERR
jgi:ferric-dicitrate binding protein FerR (iron transport regulator)